ncbi:hypothetical protein [Archangium sp.]|uniref:hypothetical protein n=1 Tax=Archangium sp. TaxID=1872627 RepID=UPI002D22B987|nr:hypothetical protein [Archangium sp.]HYO58311.1 hypothetical protein [Archangium sp.]
MPLRALIALSLMLLVPASARAAPQGPASLLAPVTASQHRDEHGHVGVLLTFKPLSPDRSQAPLSREDVRAILAVFEAVYGQQEPLPPPKYPSGPRVASAGLQPVSTAPPRWQERIRQDYEALYGSPQAPRAPLSANLEDSRFFQALRLSPQYMQEGVRETATELFNSPVFIASMAVSVTLYLAALVAPEPFLSKGVVATIHPLIDVHLWRHGAHEHRTGCQATP